MSAEKKKGVNFMARKERNDVDYFPHSVNHGKKMFFIENKYGNDGYATWFKILEELGKASYHYLDLSDETTIMFLSSNCRVTIEVLKSILDDLVKLGEFDKVLYESNVLYGEKFTESIEDAYKKRNNNCIDKKTLLLLLADKGILKPLKSNPDTGLEISKGAGNTQTILEDTKPKNSKEDIEVRKLKFSETLKPFLDTYGKTVLNDFYKYWTESNNSNTKFRREMQKTWDVARRLETWNKNDFNKNEKSSAKKGVQNVVDVFSAVPFNENDYAK